MLESKKGFDATVKLAVLMAILAKPLVTRSKTDDNAKLALVSLMEGNDLISEAIIEADRVFLEREEAAAKRQGKTGKGIPTQIAAKGKAS